MSGAIQQSQPVTPGHAAAWEANGALKDAGSADGGAISEFGITNPGSLALAINSGPITGPYVQFGVIVSPGGQVTFSFTSFEGAPAASPTYLINGVSYAFNPSGAGNITGPTGGVTDGDLVAFNGTGGNLVKDSGISAARLVTGAASSTQYDLVVFADTTGNVLADIGLTISAAMKPVLAAATTADALGLLGGAPATGGSITGALTLTAAGSALVVMNNGTIGGTLGLGGILAVQGNATFAAAVAVTGTVTAGALNLIAPLTVPSGGTGVASLSTGSVIIGNAASPVTSVAPGTAGNVLTSNGSAWVSAAPAAPSLTTGAVVLAGSAGLTGILPGAAGNVLVSNGTVWQSNTIASASFGTIYDVTSVREPGTAYVNSNGVPMFVSMAITSGTTVDHEGTLEIAGDIAWIENCPASGVTMFCGMVPAGDTYEVLGSVTKYISGKWLETW